MNKQHSSAQDTPRDATPADARSDLGSEQLESRVVALIAALTAATFIVILNETTMSNAIAKLQDYFHITEQDGQWLTSAFLLTMAIVIPLSGWIIDRFGPRGTLLIAMTAFSIGTATALVAPTFGVLLGGRVVQALGTGLMMPLLMSTLMTVVPEHRRGGVMGYVSLAISVAPALGPVLSGVIIEFLGWRWVFGLVLPMAIVVTVVGARLIPHTTAAAGGLPDLLSVVLSILGFGALVWGLSAVGEGGQSPIPGTALVGIGLVMVALLAWRQLSRKNSGKQPLLDITVFRSGGYGVGTALITVGFAAFLGYMVILPLVLQHGRGVSVLDTGLTVMPAGVAMGVLGPVVGRWYDRVGARTLVVPGAVIVVLTLGIVAWLAPTAPWFVLALVNLFLGAGLALVFTPMFTASLGAVDPVLYSHGSAILATLQQVGGAAGIATLVSVMGVGAASAGTADAPNLAVGGQWALATAAVLMVVVLAIAFFTPGRPVEAHARH